MRFFSSFLSLVFPALPLLAGAQGGALLDYRLKVSMRDDSAVVDCGFRMITTPALVTGNKVKRLRMGGWRIEPLAGRNLPSPALLARALGLCYFSGPTPQAVPLATGMKFNNRWCRLWQVQTPPEVGAYAYLVEVAPNLLTLAYLSATLPDGDIRAVEIHLAQVNLGPRTAPAEEGTALLHTLRQWSAPADPAGDGTGTEQVD